VYKKIIYFCRTIFEATHNKDYSVVKTFKAGLQPRFLFIYHFNTFSSFHYPFASGECWQKRDYEKQTTNKHVKTKA